MGLNSLILAQPSTVTPKKRAARTLLVRVAICLIWLVLVGVGFSLVLTYENTPGGGSSLAGDWPTGSALKLNTKLPTLILFAHPKCPCTRATVEELNRLLAQTEGKVSAQVWFFQPDNLPADWSRSDLWRSVEAIPGVAVNADTGGLEARRFGAETSGSVLLYSAAGRLLFKGGITGARGHVGDNAGENAIATLLKGERAQAQQTPVFGCSLLDSDKREGK